MKNILFVCVENSCRSQMAEAFANMDGQEFIKSYSAGSHPSGSVNKKAVTSMREVGYDLAVHESKGLDEIPEIEYDLVVTMGCGDECPNVRARRRLSWDIPDPKKMNKKDFAKVRDTIRKKVREMIESV